MKTCDRCGKELYFNEEFKEWYHYGSLDPYCDVSTYKINIVGVPTTIGNWRQMPFNTIKEASVHFGSWVNIISKEIVYIGIRSNRVTIFILNRQGEMTKSGFSNELEAEQYLAKEFNTKDRLNKKN